MDMLQRLRRLGRTASKAERTEGPPLMVDVDQSMLSDRRVFHLRCADGTTVPFNMADLPYTFRQFALHVHEKGLKIVEVTLEARGEPLASAAYLAEFLGHRVEKDDREGRVDMLLRLRPTVLDACFGSLPRQDDPWRVLNQRDALGRPAALVLENYEVVVWNVDRAAAPSP